MNLGGWEVWELDNPSECHVVPINDLRPHDDTDCWCLPTEDGAVLIHHSLDRREHYEELEHVS